MSNPADRVLGTPPTNTSLQMPSGPLAESAGEIETGLAIQQREREKTLHNLARLREEASAEIDRLLAFLDASDEYVMSEREEAVDDEACDDTELEPSLGSFDRMTDQSKAWRQQSLWGFLRSMASKTTVTERMTTLMRRRNSRRNLARLAAGPTRTGSRQSFLALRPQTAN